MSPLDSAPVAREDSPLQKAMHGMCITKKLKYYAIQTVFQKTFFVYSIGIAVRICLIILCMYVRCM